jgi:hypothetical protein
MIEETLRKQAAEIALAGHKGWGNTMTDAEKEINNLRAQLAAANSRAMTTSSITFEFACMDDCLNRMVPSDLRKLVAERDNLRAQLAESKKDAERYRWLRTEHSVYDNKTPYANIGYGDEGVFREALDRLIDDEIEKP